MIESMCRHPLYTKTAPAQLPQCTCRTIKHSRGSAALLFPQTARTQRRWFAASFGINDRLWPFAEIDVLHNVQMKERMQQKDRKARENKKIPLRACNAEN